MAKCGCRNLVLRSQGLSAAYIGGKIFAMGGVSYDVYGFVSLLVVA